MSAETEDVLEELIAAVRRADEKFRATIDGEWALYENDYTALRQAMWRASERLADIRYSAGIEDTLRNAPIKLIGRANSVSTHPGISEEGK